MSSRLAVHGLATTAMLLAVSLLPVSAWAKATTSTRNETINVTDDRISCSSEVVDLDGDLHLVFHATLDAAGGAHSIAHDNFQGVSGESRSGVRYRQVGAALDDGYTTHFGEGGAYQETEAERTLHLISQGPEDNAHNHVLNHDTVNANGEPTAEVSKGDSRCVG
jgi:hypothetical protein